MTSVTKDYLAKVILYHTGIPVSISTKLIDSFFSLIIENTHKDQICKIAKFGSFNVKQKKLRLARDVNTNQKVIIAPRKVVSFAVSDYVKKIINE